MLDKITEHYKDELRDIASYCSMAKDAENDMQKGILRDIAREEKQHANMLKHILEKAGKYQQTDEIKQLETDANSVMAGL